jgi:hypothetical protein
MLDDEGDVVDEEEEEEEEKKPKTVKQNVTEWEHLNDNKVCYNTCYHTWKSRAAACSW